MIDLKELVLASHNAGKLKELQAMLGDAVRVRSIGEFSSVEPEETGLSFVENAILKARNAARISGLPALADDSGLAVDVLHGAPGIFSARWAGRHGDDRANLELLLAQLADVPDAHRGAEFVCAAALAVPSSADARGTHAIHVEHVEHGRLRGTLLRAPVGDGGFGYDPILRPDGRDESTAQLSAADKNAISHRGHAFRALLPYLVDALDARP